MKKISVALGDYPHIRALLSGDVTIGGFKVEAVDVNPIIGAYRRMIRDLEFDVCELAPTSYLMAVEKGIPLTAIPVFLNRRFHHGDIQCAADALLTPLHRTIDVDGVFVIGVKDVSFNGD